MRDRLLRLVRDLDQPGLAVRSAPDAENAAALLLRQSCVVPDRHLDLVIGCGLGDRVGVRGRREVAGGGVDPVAGERDRGGDGLGALDGRLAGLRTRAVGQHRHGVRSIVVGLGLVAVEAVAAEQDALGDRGHRLVVGRRKREGHGVGVGDRLDADGGRTAQRFGRRLLAVTDPDHDHHGRFDHAVGRQFRDLALLAGEAERREGRLQRSAECIRDLLGGRQHAHLLTGFRGGDDEHVRSRRRRAG